MNDITERICPICKQNHRVDYRMWSDYFEKFLTVEEFLTEIRR